MRKLPFEFDNHMTRRQIVLGLIYLPVHMFVLPIVLPLLAETGVLPLDDGQVNLLYYGIGVLFVLAVFWKHLRAHFDNFCDRVGWCLVTILMTLGLDYVLSYAATFIMMLLPAAAETNPNNEAVMEAAKLSYGTMKAVAIFLAPIVEEVLFRGVIFGSLRKKNRMAAYAVSVLLFSLYHVWQYAVAYGDWTELLYVIQYIPVSIALAWCYERSGSIWTPIAFHMCINAMSFYVLNMVEELM